MSMRSQVLFKRSLIQIFILAIIGFLHFAEQGFAHPTSVDPNRWESVIARFENQDRDRRPPINGIVFVGSSSIRLWNLSKAFPDLPVINRGFGGSELADSFRYADRVIFPYQPRIVVIYAGDNDLHRGKLPQQVAVDFHNLVTAIHHQLPKTKILFLAIKPSLARWQDMANIREANRLILAQIREDSRVHYIDVATPMLAANGYPRSELFVADGLHLNAKGYQLWAEIQPVLIQRSSRPHRFYKKAYSTDAVYCVFNSRAILNTLSLFLTN